MRSCESAIGLLKNLQSSIQIEESWVDGQTEKLSALPTATSAYELDVSIRLTIYMVYIHNMRLTSLFTINNMF